MTMIAIESAWRRDIQHPDIRSTVIREMRIDRSQAGQPGLHEIISNPPGSCKLSPMAFLAL